MLSSTHPIAQDASTALISRPKALVNRRSGYDIHPKVADFVLGSAERYGLSNEAVCAALHITTAEIDHYAHHMSWNTFATLLNLYVSTTTHNEFVESFWESFTREPINGNLMKIFRNISSPANLYRIMDRYIGPRLIPCLKGTSKINAQGFLVDEIAHRYPEHAIPCPIYFYLVIESLRVAPVMMMGLQHAVLLDFETDGLSARYTLKLPPSRSILRRMRDATKIFMGARSLFDLLETHQQEQHQSYEHLKTINEELEHRVSTRTQELARLNEQLEKARDQAERESAAKSSYLANMSHEIRTPLSAIIGYAELLEEDAIDQVDEQSAEDLRSITASAKHLLALIGDILDLSKIEADKLSIVHQSFPLRPLIEEVLQTIKPLADQHHNIIKLSWAVPGHLVVHTDAMRLRQILTNLLSNAIKFTDYGKIFVNVERQDNTILCHIKDTGIGMSKEELSRIFNPFEQANKDTAHYHGGTGLGMTISRQLAELMGGELSATSMPGQGSTFTLMLPHAP